MSFYSPIAGSSGIDAVPSGYVSTVISSNVPIASSVSLTASAWTNITSITVPTGLWSVQGFVIFCNSTSDLNYAGPSFIGTQTASSYTYGAATAPTNLPFSHIWAGIASQITGNNTASISIPPGYFAVSGASQTFYLITGFGSFLGATMRAAGTITATKLN